MKAASRAPSSAAPHRRRDGADERRQASRPASGPRRRRGPGRTPARAAAATAHAKRFAAALAFAILYGALGLLPAAAQAQDITLTWTGRKDSGGNWTPWAGRSQDYSVKLTSLPSADVTVTIGEGSPCPHSGTWTVDTDLLTSGDQNTLTFTTADWSTAQTVRLNAQTHAGSEDELCAILHSGSGGGYDGVSKTNFVISETFDGSVHGNFLAQTINGPEGRKGEYFVYLTEEPTGDVTVTITYKSGDTDISVDTDPDTPGDQNTRTLTTSNWSNRAIHKVTIRSAEDGDTERGKAVFTHTATGGGYTESIGSRVVDATLWEVDDDDPPSKPTDLSATAGDASAALSWKAATGAESLTYSKWQYRYKTTGGYGSWTDMTNSDKDTVSYTVTGLTNGTQHTFEVRAYNDVAGEASDAASATPLAPLTFGTKTISDYGFARNVAITTLTLPAATGGDPTYTYSLSPTPPAGLTFTASSRQLSGTPTTLSASQTYTYTVTDSASTTASLSFRIAVEADSTPSVGAVANQAFVQNTAISTLTLPEATGGNSPIAYSISPTLPAGLSLDASTREITGTPTGTQQATSYTYTATDYDGDVGTQSFTIAIEADTDPSFGQGTVAAQTWTQSAAITALTLPAATGGNGTTTYTLARTNGTPALPPGLSFAAATRTLSGTPTTLQSAVGYTYTATDADGDTDTLTFDITVEADAQPSLGSVSDQTYHQDSAITALTLPAATGGNAPYTYTLARTSGSPALPPGLTFTASSRQLSGTPTGHQTATGYTYTVTDQDGDTATATFDITVTQDNSPSFADDASIADKVYVQNAAITTVTFPAATGGDTPLTYSLSPEPPTGLSFTASSRQLSGTPTALKAETAYTYTVTDNDGDTDTLTFDLTVQADTQPSLGSVSDQTYHQASAITALTLPAATGGNTPLTYTLSKTSGSPSLPPGLTFTASSRQLSGTPTGHQTAAEYTYTVTDANGDTATATFDITVTQDNSPSFADDASIADKVYVQNAAITTVTFPAATGGDTPLTYSLSPEPPTGLSFTASSRQLSGTPTALKAETAYTYTVTDADGDTDTLTFDLTVEADAQPSLGSVSDQTYHQASAITTLTLPAATGGNTPLTYTLSKTSGSPALPPGLTFTASSRQLSGTPTGHQTAAEYTYTVTDANGDTATATFDITVTQDNSPSFADDASIADKVYVQNAAITTVTFPAATGGDTPLTYSLSPEPPTGLSFTASSRQLSGTPTALKAETAYTYTVTDADGDTDTLTFDLTVEADAQPSLGSVSDQTYHQDSAITALTLPAATGGNTPLTYTLSKTSGSPALPPGLTFTASSRQLSGTPTGHQTAAEYTYTVTDANGDTATATFDITVTQDNSPSFADDASIADKVYVQNAAITTVTFPAATGGDTPLTYSLSPEPPTGLSFTASSRQLSGTPTALKAETAYTYTVTDADGDTDTLTFDLTVEADAQPTLGSVSDQTYHQDSAITALTLPAATGGNTPLTYTLSKTSGSPALPPGLTFTASSRQLSGTPTGHQTAAEYTYTVTDANGDTATATFDITVTQDNSPSFADEASIADKVYVQNAAITTVTFPAATGGDTPLTYSLSPEPPTGLSFTASSRQLSGTRRRSGRDRLHLHRHRR